MYVFCQHDNLYKKKRQKFSSYKSTLIKSSLNHLKSYNGKRVNLNDIYTFIIS